MVDPDPDRQSQAARPRHVGIQVAIWLVVALISLSALFVFFGWMQAGAWWPWGKRGAPDLLDTARSAATCVTILGGTVVASIAIRQQQSRETSVKIAQDAQVVAADAAKIAAKTAELQGEIYRLDRERYGDERAKDLRERFVTAAQQIGNERSASVRIAGLYAMSALARDWSSIGHTQDIQACLDVVCAYLRIPTATQSDGGDDSSIWAEAHVRLAAQRVLADFFRSDQDLLTDALEIDLTGATLTNFDARGAHFRGNIIWLNNVKFSGHATWFNNAAFTASRISFHGCEFETPRVHFASCRFTGDARADDSRAAIDFGSTRFGNQIPDFKDSRFTGSLRWVDGKNYDDTLPEELSNAGASRQVDN